MESKLNRLVSEYSYYVGRASHEFDEKEILSLKESAKECRNKILNELDQVMLEIEEIRVFIQEIS